MGQPLKCLLQNDLQKCPVEKYLLNEEMSIPVQFHVTI